MRCVLCVHRQGLNNAGSALTPTTSTFALPDGPVPSLTVRSSSIRDYRPRSQQEHVSGSDARHKERSISHLSWYPCSSVSYPGLYVTTMWSWLGTRREALWLAGLSSVRFSLQWQVCLYGMDVFLSNATALPPRPWPNYGAVWLPGWMEAINIREPTMCSCDRPATSLFHDRHRPWTLQHSPPLILVQRVHSNAPGGSKWIA